MNRRELLWTLGGTMTAPLAGAEKSGMKKLSVRPEDYEMPLEGFRHYITPIDQFFVRSHHYTPTVELVSWKLAIGGEVETPLSLTMDDLKKMPSVEMTAVLECAGNGRGLYEPSMPGLQWTYGGVGNGKWRGVRLVDVLKRTGVKASAKQVLFDGADVPVGTQPEFQRTLRLDKAMDRNTILAFEMNDQPLPIPHGFPLRVIAPGWASDSWVKWVTKIEVLDKDFDGFYMKTAYRHPGKAVKPGSAVKPEEMKPVEELQIKSVIAVAGAKTIGTAWSGESPVKAVDVSTDLGRTWHPAKITSPKTPFGWVTWEYNWEPPQGYAVIMSRATDTKGRSQPFEQEWNPSGYQWNVIPRAELNAGPTPQAAHGESPAPPQSFRTACLVCHGEDVSAQQRLTRTQWEAEVGKMQRWGAPVTDANRKEIIDYLVARFGPRSR